MKTQLKLNSTVPHGVGNSAECGAIELIYSVLLSTYHQDFYRHIYIYQVGGDAEETILKEPGHKVYVTTKIPTDDKFETMSVPDKNRTRLLVIHEALVRLAEFDKQLDIGALETIKRKIIEKDFDFEFEYKTYANKKNKKIMAKVSIIPRIDKFDYYIRVEEKDKILCRTHFFSGLANLFYFPYFFNSARWTSDRLILSGTQKEIEVHISLQTCTVEYKNLTPYDNPPYFTIVNFRSSKEEKEKATKDWHHSLPVGIAAIIRQAHN